MWPWLGCADPGRMHTEGRMARVALEDARDQVAAFCGTRSRQVVFTSGATEAINAAVYGALHARAGAPGRGRAGPASPWRPSSTAPSARRRSGTAARMAASSCRWIAPGVWTSNRCGAALARPGLALVHCQWANHEVGTIQPVAEVVQACRERGVLVHVDAAAAAGHVVVAFDDLGADLLSISAHKLGGPQGVGALLVRRGLRVPPLLLGGTQERARRAGLENVAAAVGFGAAAAELAGERLAAEAAPGRGVHRSACGPAPWPYRASRPTARAGAGDRLPNLVCLGIDGVEAEAVLIGLDQAGVAAHSGSACSSELLEPSPVLAAMGVDAERSLRLSVGWSTTAERGRRWPSGPCRR